MMREKKEYMVITFSATTQAMAMESRCREEGIPGRLIPVPGEITAGCGLAWRIPIDEFRQNKEKIAGLPVMIEKMIPLYL